MNFKVGLVAGLAAMLAACGPEATLEIGCDEFASQPQVRREVRLAVGDTLEVSLCSNPSTGYDWEEPQIADPKTLEATGREYQAGSGAPGSPGTTVFSFEALQRGSTTVRFSYGQPWEGGEKDSRVVVLDVVIE